MEKQDRTLLIIEDDPGLQSQLRWCFDEEKVLTAENKDTALAQYAAANPK